MYGVREKLLKAVNNFYVDRRACARDEQMRVSGFQYRLE